MISLHPNKNIGIQKDDTGFGEKIKIQDKHHLKIIVTKIQGSSRNSKTAANPGAFKEQIGLQGSNKFGITGYTVS